MEKGMFGKIRKTVEILSQSKAETELLDNPEQRHIDESFNQLRSLNRLSPEATGAIIEATINLQEVKEKIGPEGHRSLEKAMKEKMPEMIKILRGGTEQISASNLDPEENNATILAFTERALNKFASELTQDPELKKIFSGKEDLLQEAAKTVAQESMKLLRAYATFHEKS